MEMQKSRPLTCMGNVFLIGLGLALFSGADWPQGPGPHFDFTIPSADTPKEWSLVHKKNVKWFTVLPETGQSAPVVSGDRIYVTTMKPVQRDSEIGSDIVVYALSKPDGTIVWQAEIQGGYSTKLSAPFGDASAPAPIVHGDRLWVLNPTGRLACFSKTGETLWVRDVTSVSRTQPILHDGMLIFHRQAYMPDESGHFTHENKNASIERWTQIQAIDAETGNNIWVSECGANMGCIPLLQKLSDGTPVLVVGRGGGHSPPESPEGISLIRADDGQTIWTLPLEKFMSTQMYPIIDDQILVFHRGDHLWVDARSGKISRTQSIVKNVTVSRWTPHGHQNSQETLQEGKPRSITQQSNIRVGNYHYFRAYTKNYLGRIHLGNGKVEYLELPLQVLREPKSPDKTLWSAEQWPTLLASLDKRRKKKRDLTTTSFRLNQVRNSRGYLVMGDERAQANGWGHTASPLPTAFGNDLVVPILSGMVFVIRADAKKLDQKALLSINDLGPLGKSFTRASLTTDGRIIFAHTIQGIAAFAK